MIYDENMIILMLLVTLYLSPTVASTSHHHHHHRKDITKKPCSEPNEEYLELLYSKYTSAFREYEAELFKSYINNTRKPDDGVYKFDRKEFMNEGACNPNNPHQAKFAKKPFCPWIYILYERDDKYPRYV